jgi:RES domain-containing protein
MTSFALAGPRPGESGLTAAMIPQRHLVSIWTICAAVQPVDAEPPRTQRYLPSLPFTRIGGAGAAIGGRRFNWPGIEALYLAADPATALAEYRQGASIALPATLVAYRVDVGSVMDFSGGYATDAWSEVWAEAGCDWKYLARVERTDPLSWRIGDALIREGLKGLLFPSYRHAGGINLRAERRHGSRLGTACRRHHSASR